MNILPCKLVHELTFGYIYKSGIIEFAGMQPIYPDGTPARIDKKRDRVVRNIYANKKQNLPGIMVDYCSIKFEPVYFKTPHGVTAFVNVVSWDEVEKGFSILWRLPFGARVSPYYVPKGVKEEEPEFCKRSHCESYNVSYDDFNSLPTLNAIQKEELNKFKADMITLKDRINSISDEFNSYFENMEVKKLVSMGKFPTLQDTSGGSSYGRQEFYTSSRKVYDVEFFKLGDDVITMEAKILEVKDRNVTSFIKVSKSHFSVNKIEVSMVNEVSLEVNIGSTRLSAGINQTTQSFFQNMEKVDLNGQIYILFRGEAASAKLVEAFSTEYSHTEEL